MDYKDYELEDLLSDDFFVAWVKQPNATTDHFWQKWLAQHPEKASIVAEAKWILTSVGYQNQLVPTEQEYQEVLKRVQQKQKSRLYHLSHGRQRSMFLRYAASIALLLA